MSKVSYFRMSVVCLLILLGGVIFGALDQPAFGSLPTCDNKCRSRYFFTGCQPSGGFDYYGSPPLLLMTGRRFPEIQAEGSRMVNVRPRFVSKNGGEPLLLYHGQQHHLLLLFGVLGVWQNFREVVEPEA